MYQIDELVRIAKREKNKKRSYLFVNPLQGKHIPADPMETEELCSSLSQAIDADYQDLKKYVIGFAETATGVSAAVCNSMKNVLYYEHTTREYSRKREYIYFTESHSHAKEQLLDLKGIDRAISSVEVVILIDDEITTGNTVCKLISQLKERYKFRGLFIIASLINSMTDERIAELKKEGIECRYVLRIPHEYKAELAEGINEKQNFDEKYEYYSNRICYETIPVKTNPREVIAWPVYINEVIRTSEIIANSCKLNLESSVCIIGTEEFMFLTIILGNYLLENGMARNVRVHSTTRSPIVPSSQKGYPLESRYKLNSFYSENRTTYIYNLSKYDKVIVVTDGSCRGKGLQSLVSALRSVGNDNIYIYRCKYEK